MSTKIIEIEFITYHELFKVNYPNICDRWRDVCAEELTSLFISVKEIHEL